MTHHLRRGGHQVAYCTVDRLMTTLGRNGIRRGKAVRTTMPGKDGTRAADLVNRNFTAAAPNRVWVADFTYCRTWAGFCYVAFIVDVFAQRIVAWHAATDKRTDLVLIPLRIALWDRDRHGTPVRPGELICHSDAGSQGGFNWSSQHLDQGGVDGTWQEGETGPSCGWAAAVGGGSGVAAADAFTGPAGAVSGGAAGLLAPDCVGCDDGRGR
jgi:putative transposase